MNRGIKADFAMALALACLCAGADTFAQTPPAGQCPQPRFTGRAPDAVYALSNPLGHSPENIAAGRRLYEKGAQPACRTCHGLKGDGRGPLAAQFDPPPRNFACAKTVNGIPDGQLFWIIQNGSPGTSMPSFPALSEEQVWQVVLYLRELAR